jgi:uncharacterized protein DUF1573
MWKTITFASSSTRLLRARSMRWPCVMLFCANCLIGCAERKAAPPGGIFDAGPVFAHRTPVLTHRFHIKNSTDRKVNIISESHSCSCANVNISEPALEPGGSADLTLIVNVPRDYGKRHITCDVKTDHPTFPEWAYHLEFESYPRAALAPDPVQLGTYHMGSRPASKTEADWIRDIHLAVYAPTSEVLPDIVTISPPKEIEVAIDWGPRIETMDGGVVRALYGLRCGIRPGAHAAGSFIQPVIVNLRDGSSASAMVAWCAVGPWTVSPSHLHFGIVQPGGKSITKRVLIKSNDQRSFKIISVECGSSNVGLTNTETKSACDQWIELELLPPANDGQKVMAGSIKVRTDVDGEDLIIPWSAFLRKSSTKSVDGNPAISLPDMRSER